MKASDLIVSDCDTEVLTLPNKEKITIRGLSHDEEKKLRISLKSDDGMAVAWAIHVCCGFEGDEKESIEVIKTWPKKLTARIESVILRLSYGGEEKKS